MGVDFYAVCVENIRMKQMLSDRTAAAIVALTAQTTGLRLAELAKLTQAPLSTAQRTVEALQEEGLVVRDGDTRPRYRIAPEAPAEALLSLASWRLTPPRAFAIRQQAAAMWATPQPRPDIERHLRAAVADPEVASQLKEMAERLIWWQSAQRSLRTPERLVAQAMAIGSDNDVQRVEKVFGIEAMRAVLASAPPGVFDPRKWDYWHLRFGYKRTPPLPVRS